MIFLKLAMSPANHSKLRLPTPPKSSLRITPSSHHHARPHPDVFLLLRLNRTRVARLRFAGCCAAEKIRAFRTNMWSDVKRELKKALKAKMLREIREEIRREFLGEGLQEARQAQDAAGEAEQDAEQDAEQEEWPGEEGAGHRGAASGPSAGGAPELELAPPLQGFRLDAVSAPRVDVGATGHRLLCGAEAKEALDGAQWRDHDGPETGLRVACVLLCREDERAPTDLAMQDYGEGTLEGWAHLRGPGSCALVVESAADGKRYVEAVFVGAGSDSRIESMRADAVRYAREVPSYLPRKKRDGWYGARRDGGLPKIAGDNRNAACVP